MGVNEMKDIVIIGAGGFGREVAWLIEDINKDKAEWNIMGFVDENPKIKGNYINSYKVLGDIEWLKRQDCYAVCAIGDPIAKKTILEKLEGSKVKYPILIHPSVIMSDNIEIGEGSIICAGNLVTVNIKIGKHVIINLDCTIGHDANIHNYCTILPSVNVSGAVNIGECVNIGTGTQIIQGINIGRNTIIGAGSVVIRDLPSNCTAVGLPASAIKYHE